MDISKEQFEKVYNKYLPNKFIVFIFKHYAQDDEKTSGVKIKLADKIAWFVLLPLFFLGLLFTAFKLPQIYIGIVTIPYLLILSVLVLAGFVAVKWNNFRIKKIAKELGLGLVEYNKLVDDLFR